MRGEYTSNITMISIIPGVRGIAKQVPLNDRLICVQEQTSKIVVYKIV